MQLPLILKCTVDKIYRFCCTFKCILQEIFRLAPTMSVECLVDLWVKLVSKMPITHLLGDSLTGVRFESPLRLTSSQSSFRDKNKVD